MLYIIRHAWAEEYGDPAWPDDHLRPLTREGKKRFACMVRKLVKRGMAPERIVTSPLVRCRQTAQILAQAAPGSPEIVPREELSPGADLERVLEWTHREPRVWEVEAWVGHAPDVGRLAAGLIGNAESSIRFAKGAVAAIEFPDRPAAREGELRWLVTAQVLGC